MDIIAWLIIGLVTGGAAILIVPERKPGGTMGSMLVAIVGEVIILFLLQVVVQRP